MIFAEAVSATDITTIGSLLGAALIWILRDIAVKRKQQPIEESKIQNLNQQTVSLQQIAELMERTGHRSRKDAKKIQRKLDGIHADVLTVKQQTKKETKP